MINASKAHHRHLVSQREGKYDLILGEQSSLPGFAKDSFAGREPSHHKLMGTRTKYQRILQKNLFGNKEKNEQIEKLRNS